MTAIISACGLYRYRLEREVCEPFDGSKVFAFFGVNPSTADATLDDATVRKWRGFTQRNGGHKFIVGNVFSYRATDVRALKVLPLDVAHGPECWDHFFAICNDADVLVPCWGSTHKVSKNHHTALKKVSSVLMGYATLFDKPILHFGVTDSGDPKHPLMLPYSTPLTPWSFSE